MISVICPFYNERGNLGDLFLRLKHVLDGVGEAWEMIFVDDGSTDGGPEFLRSLAARDSRVQVLELDQNHGLSTALYAGFQQANGNIFVTLDADLQNPPEEIPKLLDALKGYDVVTGIRTKRHDSFLRKVSSEIANAVRRTVTGDHLLDVGCSLRAFRREVAKVFYPYDGMHRFFMTAAEAQGFKIRQMPVDHASRRAGKSKYGIRNRLFKALGDLYAFKWIIRRKIQYKIRRASRV